MFALTTNAPASWRLNIGLWSAQILLAAMYGMVGFMKLTQPIPELTASMGWPGLVPVVLVRFIGLAELAGALGLILPMLTKILPRLTVFAALGLVALQVAAMSWHISLGEFFMLPINITLLALAGFVAYGRHKTLPRAVA